MSLTAGALSLVSVSQNTANLSSAVATSGTSPYTYQWYRSTTTGFTPGGGNIIAGATSLTLADTGLIPNTQYYYKVKVTDSAGSPATADSAQLGVQTSVPSLNPNQFTQASIVGMIDMRFDYDTISAQIDLTQSGSLYAGQAVKLVPNTAGGVPKVIGCTANTDSVFGFINFDIKTVAFLAGAMCEISQEGNFMYLYATTAITQGARVTLDVSTVGGVSALVGSSGAAIVGWAMDGAAAAGDLIRVRLYDVPAFSFA